MNEIGMTFFPVKSSGRTESQVQGHATFSVLRPLMLVVAFLVGVSLLQELIIYRLSDSSSMNRIERLSIDKEKALGAWFSSMMMVAIAIALITHGAANKLLSGPAKARWTFLGLVFFYLSADEAIEIHELGDRLLRGIDLPQMFYFAWVVLAIPVVATGLLLYIPFIREFQGRNRFFLLLSAFLFLGGALGIEMITGYAISSGAILRDSLEYQYFAHVEETGEMLGLVLFFATILWHSRDEIGPMTVLVER